MTAATKTTTVNAAAFAQERNRVLTMDDELNASLPKGSAKYKMAVSHTDQNISYYKLDTKTYLTAREHDTSPQKSEIAAAAKLTDKITAQKTDKPVDKTPTTDDGKSSEFFRCMYAGYIIKSGICRAPSALPSDVKLPGVTADNFNCESQVSCNPLLFGGTCPPEDLTKALTDKDGGKKCLAEMKGLCVDISATATHDCFEKANSDKQNLQITSLLIAASPEAWTQYTESFRQLCDEERIVDNAFLQKKGIARRTNSETVKQDVLKTCNWARERLVQLRDEFKSDTKLKSLDKAKLDAVKGQK
jgi:hypothetical protein